MSEETKTEVTVTEDTGETGLSTENDNGKGLTPKQEAFAQAYVETGNATEAHQRAGYGASMSKKTRNEAASRLLASSKVRARVAELQAEHRKRHDYDIDKACAEYEEHRLGAVDTVQFAAANGATAGKARLHGHDKGTGNVNISIQQNTVKLSRLELARRMAHIMDDGVMAKEDA